MFLDRLMWWQRLLHLNYFRNFVISIFILFFLLPFNEMRKTKEEYKYVMLHLCFHAQYEIWINSLIKPYFLELSFMLYFVYGENTWITALNIRKKKQLFIRLSNVIDVIIHQKQAFVENQIKQPTVILFCFYVYT